MKRLLAAGILLAVLILAAFAGASSGATGTGMSVAAPDQPTGRDDTTAACTSPPPVHTYAWYHCYAVSDPRRLRREQPG